MNFGEKKRGRIQGLPKFFGYPLLSQVHPKKPIKNFREKGAWAYPGTAQFFRVPPIISGTSKATKFKFCVHIYKNRLHRNKSPLKISRKVAVGGRSQGLVKIFRAAIHRAHRADIFAIAQLSCYRAMHFSAKRGIAIVYCPSVCLSVCNV